MQCTNISCGKQLDEGTKFCAYCGTNQLTSQDSVMPQGGTWADKVVRQSMEDAVAEPGKSGVSAAATPPPLPPNATSSLRARQELIDNAASGAKSSSQSPLPQQASAPALEISEPGLIMRASDSIWSFDDPEGNVAPGYRRALVIFDEQVTHLAHTDRVLAPQELLQRTQKIIEAQQVPVDIQLVDTCWIRNRHELRPRIVASLQDSNNRNIKMVFGVDYLGKWASISMLVGIEPDPIPLPPKGPEKVSKPPRPALPPQEKATNWFAIGCLLVGALLALSMGQTGVSALLLGLILIGVGIWHAISQEAKNSEEDVRRKAEWEEEYKRQQQKVEEENKRREIEHKRALEDEHRKRELAEMEKLFRTFRVDDTRLFTAAMSTVYKAVVDDIISHGGEVVRVSGGRGGFIDNDGIASAMPGRKHDAATADV